MRCVIRITIGTLKLALIKYLRRHDLLMIRQTKRGFPHRQIDLYINTLEKAEDKLYLRKWLIGGWARSVDYWRLTVDNTSFFKWWQWLIIRKYSYMNYKILLPIRPWMLRTIVNCRTPSKLCWSLLDNPYSWLWHRILIFSGSEDWSRQLHQGFFPSRHPYHEPTVSRFLESNRSILFLVCIHQSNKSLSF